MAYDNTNTGMLSSNDRKETEKHPDFNGFADIEGTEYWISGWIREAGPQAKNPGRKFFSLRFEPKVAKDTQFGDDGHARPYGAATTTRYGSANGARHMRLLGPPRRPQWLRRAAAPWTT